MTNTKTATVAVAKGAGLVASGMVGMIGWPIAAAGLGFGAIGAAPIVLAPMFGNPGFSVEYVKATWKMGAMAWSIGGVGVVMMAVGAAGVKATTGKELPVLSTTQVAGTAAAAAMITTF